MLIVETIGKVHFACHRDGKSSRQIARDFRLSRNTVKKALRGEVTEFTYERTSQLLPKLGPYVDTPLSCLEADAAKPRREQRTAVMLFLELQQEGLTGGYDSVRRYIQK